MCNNAEERVYWIVMKVHLSQCSVSLLNTGQQQFKDSQKFGLNLLAKNFISYFFTMVFFPEFSLKPDAQSFQGYSVFSL